MNLLIAKSRPPQSPPPPAPPRPPSALEAVGNILSLPGSSARDLLVGRNPFDQWATPTQDINRTSGRDVLRHFKIVDPNKNNWTNAVAGFAVEVATDPLTYTGIGALTKAGKAASKAGLVKNIGSMSDAVTKTPKALIDAADDANAAMKAWRTAGGTDDLLNKPLKAIVSFKLPKAPALELSGNAALPAAKAIDSLSNTIMDLPGARKLRAAFDPKVLNTITKTGQEVAQARHQTVKDELAAIGKQWAPLVDAPDAEKAKSLFDNTKKLAADAGLDMSKLPADDAVSLSGAEHFTRAAGVAHAATELLAKAARRDGIGVPLDAALDKLGMNTRQARLNLTQHAGEDLSSLTIDHDLLDDALQLVKPFTDPEIASTARKAIEKFTTIFKSNVTVPFPAFHSRNIASGIVRNIVKGFADESQVGPMRYVRPLVDAYRLTTGKQLRGLSKLPESKGLGLSDAEASTMLKHEAFAHHLIGDSSIAADLAGRNTRMPGGPVFSKTPKGTTFAQAANPLLVAGGLSNQTKFLPARIGGDIAQFGESINRLSGFIALRKSGYAPEEAARLVKNAQVDYSQAAAFESKYAATLIPFWKFSKGMLSDLLDELVHQPGGRAAMSLKANARASQDNKKPHWLSNQTTVPLDDGKTFAAGGLMTDSAATLIGLAAQANARGISADIANRLNPLIKHPIEMATGQSLFHQRPLSTVTPDVGGTIENLQQWAGAKKQKPVPFISQSAEHLARNSPFSRYLSTARKLTDKEKAVQNMIAAISGATAE